PPATLVDGQQVFFTSSEDLTFLEPESVDFVVTSPPYWNLKEYGHASEIGQSPYDEYLERLTAVWTSCYRVAKPNAVMVVNVANRRRDKAFYPIGLDIAQAMKGWVLWDILIWYIPNALPQSRHYVERLF